MVIIRFRPVLAHSNDGPYIRLLDKVNSKDAIQGRLLEIKQVKPIRSFFGLHIFSVVGEEIYFNPKKEIVNPETQRFVDMSDKDNKDCPYINAWWELEKSFKDFHAEQHEISVLSHVRFKDPLFPVLNNFAIKQKN